MKPLLETLSTIINLFRRFCKNTKSKQILKFIIKFNKRRHRKGKRMADNFLSKSYKIS